MGCSEATGQRDGDRLREAESNREEQRTEAPRRVMGSESRARGQGTRWRSSKHVDTGKRRECRAREGTGYQGNGEATGDMERN